MTRDEVVQRLSTVALLVCLAVFAGVIALVFSPGLRTLVGVGPEHEPPPYGVGDRVDVDAKMYGGTPHTLLVFARSTCAACQRSVPAYAEAVTAAAERGVPAWMITPDPDVDTERAFAASLGIALERVSYAAIGTIRLRAVPLLLLVNQQGVIQRAWSAAPDPALHAAILDTLRALPGTGR